jgi:flagellar FliJ protein
MSQLRSFVLAIELATRQRDELARALARAEKTLQFAQNQMHQLEGYATETDARWLRPTPDGRTTELLRHHYQFVGRLQQAIGLQSGVISNSGQQVENAKQLLMQAECRLAALNQILKSRQADLLRLEARREQRQTDEFAAMQHARKQLMSRTGEYP